MGDLDKTTQDQVGVIRGILKSEFTWALFVISGVFGFVTSVALPIQKIQLQIAQVQADINENSLFYQKLDIRVTAVELDQARINAALSSTK